MADDTAVATTGTDTTSDSSATGDAPDLGDAGKQAIARMKAERDDARRQAKAGTEAIKRLAELEESQKTEAQKLADRVAAAEKERDDYRLEATRTKVALSKGLPPELADRLKGATEEELTADADTLLSLVPNGSPRPKADVDQGARQTTPKTDMNAALRAAFGR